MTVRWERFSGRTDRFAVRLSLALDPHDGDTATPEDSASWGAIQIWASGQNLTANLDQGEVLSSAHWYLLPLVEWLAENWDPLLHEERLPNINSADTAATALELSKHAPALATEIDVISWETAWYDWWKRHCLQSGREGGLLPNVVLRRVRDYVEVSWNDHPTAGAPNGFGFTTSSGAELFEPAEVAGPLFEVATAMVDFLVDLGVPGPRLDAVRTALSDVHGGDRYATRVRWLAAQESHRAEPGGWAPNRKDPATWDDMVRSLHEGADPRAVDAALATEKSELVISRSSPAALLFSTVSPTVTGDDVRALSALLLDSFTPHPDHSELLTVGGSVPLDDRVPVWEQGYDLAEHLHDVLNLDITSGWVDVEAVLQAFGVRIVKSKLTDPAIRACSVFGPQHRPTVLRNQNVNLGESAWRFVAAHELCHLLFDRAHGVNVSIASGQWAPRGLERRANAFAAMFLMPVQLVEQLVANTVDPLVEKTELLRLADTLRVTPRAAVHHFYNLTLMTEWDRDELFRALGGG